jgi:DNA (cytosine-5)-methyltransferase 1
MLQRCESDCSPEMEWFESADCITAGFPCQDISHAGQGAGLAGERSGLWWQVRRTLRMVRPRVALLENVAALLNRGMGTVLGGLAAVGYDAEWHCIPAAAVGAPHERDRCWIIAADAYRNGKPALAFDAEVEAAPQPGDAEEARRPHAEGRPGPSQPKWWAFLAAADVGPGARHWPPESPLVRVVDGLSADVDAVAALGNSVVPEIPYRIGRAILKAEGIA